MVRRFNLWLTGFGALVFGAALVILTLAPGLFNAAVKQFVVSEVAGRLDASLGVLMAEAEGLQPLSDRLPEAVRDRLPEEIRTRLEWRERTSSRQMQFLVERIVDLACENDCDEDVRPEVTAAFEEARASLGAAEGRVRDFVLAQFDNVLAEVRVDLSIFVTTNFLLCAAAFALAMLSRVDEYQLLRVSVVLTLTTGMMVNFYLRQDWLLAVVFNQYWGMGYPFLAAYLAFRLGQLALAVPPLAARTPSA